MAHPNFKNKIKGVRNPVDVYSILSKSNDIVSIQFDRKVFNIITVCRLDNTSKALDRLILIVKKLKEDGLDFIWRIVGDGPYREEMERQINEYNIGDKVLLMGHNDNPIPYVKQSSLFVLQSYYEGYPLSVCESLIVNTPALITNFPSCHELIENGVTGIIVNNDFSSIYKALVSIMKDKDRLSQIRLNLSKIDKNYYERIDSLLSIIGG